MQGKEGKQFRRRRVRGQNRIKVSVTIRPSLIRKCDAYAEMVDWTRSGVVELVLEKELSHVMDEALGMLGKRRVIRDGEAIDNSERDNDVREVE